MPVVSIEDCAFEDCSSLTSITIPDSVTSIGEFAFVNCSNLVSVIIPCNVTSIGMCAFANSIGITTITVDEDNEYYSSINGNLYSEDLSILVQYAVGKTAAEFIIPDGVTSIGEGAFYNCESLTNITIPNSVRSIGEDAFGECTGLTNITIPNSVTSIGDYAFEWCSSLVSITIPNSVTSIPDGAFMKCTSLMSIDIPDSVTSIGYYAFSSCGLSNITIPNSITKIGRYAFSGTPLITAAIPDTVIEIGELAFCNRLAPVTKLYCEFETQPDSWDANWCDGSSVIWGITIAPDGAVYSINEDGSSYSFVNIAGCNDIIYSIFPSLNGLPVKCIQDYVFNGAQATVKSVIIPNTVTEIIQSAFSWSYSLVEVINNSEVVISLESIAEYNNILELHTGESKIVSKDDYLFYTYEDANYLVGYVGQDTSLVLPKSYNSESYRIWNYAFWWYDDITSVIIPDSVTSIGDHAFEGCSSLTSITIGDGVTSIGCRAFYRCSSLTSITIPDGVTNIGWSAFSGCSRLTSVIIGNSVTSIGDSAFSDCSRLASVTIPNSVTSIGKWTFSGCSSLTYNEYDGAYYLGNDDNQYVVLVKAMSKDITSCTIHDNTKFIHSDAFSGCENLKIIALPNTVTYIGDYAFEGCSSLTNVVFENPNGWKLFASGLVGGSLGVSISAGELSDPGNAASYFKQHDDGTWYRSEE